MLCRQAHHSVVERGRACAGQGRERRRAATRSDRYFVMRNSSGKGSAAGDWDPPWSPRTSSPSTCHVLEQSVADLAGPRGQHGLTTSAADPQQIRGGCCACSGACKPCSDFHFCITTLLPPCATPLKPHHRRFLAHFVRESVLSLLLAAGVMGKPSFLRSQPHTAYRRNFPFRASTVCETIGGSVNY